MEDLSDGVAKADCATTWRVEAREFKEHLPMHGWLFHPTV